MMMVGADVLGGVMPIPIQPAIPIAEIIDRRITVTVIKVAEMLRNRIASIMITARNINGIKVLISF